jgi:hypothetical protein
VNPAVAGMIFGVIGIGAPLSLICWYLGYERALRKLERSLRADTFDEAPTGKGRAS